MNKKLQAEILKLMIGSLPTGKVKATGGDYREWNKDFYKNKARRNV